jgi:hypothetical protein
MPKIKSKQWYNSKTCWSAILKGLVGVITIAVSFLDGELGLQEAFLGAIPLVWGAVDFVIRFKTVTILK